LPLKPFIYPLLADSPFFWHNVPIMSEIKQLTQKIKAFRDARDWKQFHNHKDVALSLVLEATEVLEHFQWKSPKEVKNTA
jgi:hypothetical protein